MKTILVDAVQAFVIPDYGIYEEMYTMLETYSHPKIILTGANDEEMKLFGLDNMPYEVFTLHHNPEKSNPLYYEKMLAYFCLDIDDVVYFENKKEAVKSAQSV